MWVRGRDGHREVGTNPLCTTDLRLSICKEPLPYREARREWRATSLLLPAERPLLGTRVSIPVREDLTRGLGDLVRACASSPSYWIESPPTTAYNIEPSENSPPPCSQKTRRSKGNMMVLTPQRRWARVPSTHPSGTVGPLVPRASERRPKALCSPVVGKGRLVPTTLFGLSLGETVEAPARMPAQGGAATPSRGGREGIDGSGVSRRPEANRRNASFVYYSSRRKRNNTLN
jgi:hypothetical protein